MIVDFLGRKYLNEQLIKFAKDEWLKCYQAGDYYFIQDYPKNMRSLKTALKFLNNLYEMDKRQISFEEI